MTRYSRDEIKELLKSDYVFIKAEAPKVITQLLSDLEEAEKIKKELIKGLEFYAEERHFRSDSHIMITNKMQIHLPEGYGFMLDKGEVARTTLAKLRGNNER